ncbi:hypothetical protein BHYA_0040g00150 [Botrytis hyacinthi]|uniref:Rhodopsin domain-containing protein n=1 Tax=Botrytis hyacinthi TaxID=278943 RepID=A0A4Z1H4J6_9HELO|nr:hypothetical protein BHYA_0040g00150 [Botrytis hyacinthi]
MSTPSEILNLPPEVLATIPLGSPPAGVQALPPNPVSRGWLLISVSSILFFMATTCFTIRVYTRVAIQRKVARSDLVTSGGTVGLHEWDYSFLDLIRKRNLVPFYISAIVINPAFGLVKLSIFVMYLEIFAGLRWMQICVYIGATFSSAFYLAVTILHFYLMTPFGSETFASKLFTPQYAMYVRLGIPTSAISFGIDIYLLVLPLVAVSNLRIPTKQKILMMVGFTVGILLVELFCGVIIACYPSLLLFSRTHRKKFSGMGSMVASWLCCTKCRKSDTVAKSSQDTSNASERTPAEDKNLYPNLDFLTRPGDIERGDLERQMENRIGRDAIAV